MSGYRNGADRGQMALLPERLEDFVAEDNEVRVIDAFVDGLDLVKLEVHRAGRVHVSFSGTRHSFAELHPSRIEGYLVSYEGIVPAPAQAYQSGHFVLEKTSDVGYDGPEDD